MTLWSKDVIIMFVTYNIVNSFRNIKVHTKIHVFTKSFINSSTHPQGMLTKYPNFNVSKVLIIQEKIRDVLLVIDMNYSCLQTNNGLDILKRKTFYWWLVQKISYGGKIRIEVTTDRRSEVNWEGVWRNVFIIYCQLSKKKK